MRTFAVFPIALPKKEQVAYAGQHAHRLEFGGAALVPQFAIWNMEFDHVRPQTPTQHSHELDLQRNFFVGSPLAADPAPATSKQMLLLLACSHFRMPCLRNFSRAII